MRRNILFLLVITALACIKIKAQNEYTIALDIQDNRDGILTSTVQGIQDLQNFIKAPFAPATDVNLVRKQLEIYLKSLESNTPLPQNSYDYGLPQSGGDRAPGSVLGGGMFSPLLSESEIIYAVTDVLVQRAKEEIALAYFDRLVKKYETPVEFTAEGKTFRFELKNLFPNFYFLAKNIRMNFNMQIGTTFLSAFQKDLKSFYGNLDKYVFPEELKKEAYYTILNGFYVTLNELHNSTHPITILRKLRPRNITANYNYAGHIFNIAAGISESLLGKDPYGSGLSWLTSYELQNKYVMDAEGMKYYLGLLYFNPAIRVSFDKIGVKIDADGEEGPAAAAKLSDNVSGIIGRFTEIQSQMSSLGSFYGDPSEEKTVKVEFKVADGLLSVVKEVYNLWYSESGTENEINKRIRLGFESAGNLRDFFKSLSEKNFGSAVLSVMQIINSTAGEESVNPEIFKFLTLAADISQAENSEAAAKIFESAIMPVGSYKLKRSSGFSSSVSSFVGAAAGSEWLDEVNLRPALFAAPFLPIGIDLSWSSGDQDNQSASHSLFLSIIDLGTVAGYRFKNDGDNNFNAENVPPVKFQHIISPGVFYVFGFKSSPIALGAGVQFSPRLRAITDANNIEVSRASAFRAVAFIAVDIPLFNLTAK